MLTVNIASTMKSGEISHCMMAILYGKWPLFLVAFIITDI
jgi:hypothetical protein